MANIPKMHDVESSNIAAIGHDPMANELHVRFSSGAHYVYSDFDADKFDTFKSADSIGSHFARNIKNNHEFKRHNG